MDTIDAVVPKPTSRKNNNIYKNNKKIKNLYDSKSKALTNCNALRKWDPQVLRRQTKAYKELIKIINKQIPNEIKVLEEKRWDKLYKKINYKVPEKFLPLIKEIIKPQGRQEDIKNFTLDESDIAITEKLKNLTDETQKVDNKVIYSNPVDKLNVLELFTKA